MLDVGSDSVEFGKGNFSMAFMEICGDGSNSDAWFSGTSRICSAIFFMDWGILSQVLPRARHSSGVDIVEVSKRGGLQQIEY